VVEDSNINPVEKRENSDEVNQANIAIIGYIPDNHQSQKCLKIIREKLIGLEKEYGIVDLPPVLMPLVKLGSEAYYLIISYIGMD